MICVWLQDFCGIIFGQRSRGHWGRWCVKAARSLFWPTCAFFFDKGNTEREERERRVERGVARSAVQGNRKDMGTGNGRETRAERARPSKLKQANHHGPRLEEPWRTPKESFGDSRRPRGLWGKGWPLPILLSLRSIRPNLGKHSAIQDMTQGMSLLCKMGPAPCAGQHVYAYW